MKSLLDLVRRPRTAARPYEDEVTRLAWQSSSLLLGYPGDDLYARLPLIRSVAETLPEAVGGPILRLVDWLDDVGTAQACAEFVATFDYTRNCSPYLTYFSMGDTRKRGVALVQFKQAYRRGGAEIGFDELPDHICVVLEYGATVDVDIAWRLLCDHRPGLEVLRLALSDRTSPWVDAVAAVSATLPPLAGQGQEAVRRLLAAGPPSEDVGLGLDAYSLDPRLNPVPHDPELTGARP